MNKLILFGRLTRDPELTYLPSQTPVVEFGIATSRKYKDNDGQLREEVCFVDCQMFGKRAEAINQYVHKGDLLLIEGRLKFDRWEAQDGTKRSKHRVFVENFEFGGNKTSQGDQGSTGQSEAHTNEQGNRDGFEDDSIPF